MKFGIYSSIANPPRGEDLPRCVDEVFEEGPWAEQAQSDGVVEAISQRAIAELEARLAQGAPQHLVGRHSFGSGRALGLAVQPSPEIPPDQVGYLGIGVQDLVDFLPLLLGAGAAMLEDERGLGIANHAHFQYLLCGVYLYIHCIVNLE